MIMPIPKKRGPKGKKVKLLENQEALQKEEKCEEQEEECHKPDENITNEKIQKKRGRKPKGGKIINENITELSLPQSCLDNLNNSYTKPNIILHLKCSMNDLFEYNKSITDQSISIHYSNKTENKVPEYYLYSSSKDKLLYQNYDIKKENNINNDNYYYYKNTIITPNIEIKEEDEEENSNYDEYIETPSLKNKINKEIHKKLKQLELSLHNNNLDKKSYCFWCTCEFDNHAVYIPKSYMFNTYNVYGCFCSPECACAFLMNENIDNASKFERYYLLNNVYSEIYNKKNIKPAPNPYYMLNKFYGNLTIQEYRSLLQNDRLFLVVNKPMTRTMPELIEDNDEYILNKKIIPCNTSTNSYHKKIQKKNQSKNMIMNEKFGLSSICTED